MFQLSLILAALMMLTAHIPYLLRPRWMPVVAFLIWGSLWFCVVYIANNAGHPPAVVWLFWILLLATPIARLAKLHWGWFEAICLSCTLVAYGISLYEFMPAYHEHQELLARYPATDLKPRLAYEHRTALSTPADSNSTADVFSTATSERPLYSMKMLKELDDRSREYLDLGTFRIEYRKNDRRLAFGALMKVHVGFVADFIAQPGLGRSRLPGIKLLRKADLKSSFEDIDLDAPPERIDQPDRQHDEIDSSSNGPHADQAAGQDPAALQKHDLTASDRLPGNDTLESFHRDSITNFVPLNSLGGVNDRLEARGFLSHAFHLAPDNLNVSYETFGWRFARLELVSLLKHQPPAAYVSEHLPWMNYGTLQLAPSHGLSRTQLQNWLPAKNWFSTSPMVVSFTCWAQFERSPRAANAIRFRWEDSSERLLTRSHSNRSADQAKRKRWPRESDHSRGL